MKTHQIEKEILLGLESRLNEISGKIMMFWRSQWQLWESANYEITEVPGYQEAMEHSLKVYNSYVELYAKISVGIYQSMSCDTKTADEHIQKAKEQYIRSIEHNHTLYAKKKYYELCGYDSTKSYADKHNRNIMKSYAASLVVFFMKGRKSANLRMHKDAKDAVEAAKAKLFKQVHKVLFPIADDIQTMTFKWDDKSPVGLVGCWTIHCCSGKKYVFKTQCIEAGGYNIQCWHYRYICSLKELS